MSVCLGGGTSEVGVESARWLRADVRSRMVSLAWGVLDWRFARATCSMPSDDRSVPASCVWTDLMDELPLRDHTAQRVEFKSLTSRYGQIIVGKDALAWTSQERNF